MAEIIQMSSNLSATARIGGQHSGIRQAVVAHERDSTAAAFKPRQRLAERLGVPLAHDPATGEK